MSRIIRAFSAALFVFAVAVSVAIAQPEPVKFGKVSAEDFAVDSFPGDTTATAIVLVDYAETQFEARIAIRSLELKIVTKRTVRIKILSEAGYEHAEIKLPYYAEDGIEDVRKLKAATYTLQENGKIKKTSLSKKEIFTEEPSDGWKQKKFTMANLSPGAIIEYTYVQISTNPTYLDGWEFQSELPTLWSEYRLSLPRSFTYVQVTRGYHPFEINEREFGHSQKISTVIGQETLEHRYAMKNVPALRAEPFMTAMKDHRAAIRFQLAKYSILDQTQLFMENWFALAKSILSGPVGSELSNRNAAAGRKTKEITEGIEDPEQKLSAIYDFVRQNITWNEYRGTYPMNGVGNTLKDKTGSVADIALLTTVMLRKAGIEADPVLVSTRDNGRVITDYPIRTQFNYMIAVAKIGEKRFFLDATRSNTPYDIIPSSALNYEIWKLNERPEWIQLTPKERLNHSVSVTATLAEDGTLTGSVDARESGYMAVRIRNRFDDGTTSESYLKNSILGEYEEVSVDSSDVRDLGDIKKPLMVSGEFTLKEAAQSMAGFIYFNPIISGRYEKNPFSLEERKFPVDFVSRINESFMMNLTIPDGYVVDDVPANVMYQTPDRSARFRRLIQVDGNKITIVSKLNLLKPVYKADQYDALRTLFAQMVSATSEQLVLKKADPQASN